MDMMYTVKRKRKGFFDRRSKAEAVLFTAVFVLFFIYACTLLYIIVFMFLNSFKTPPAYYDDSFVFPKDPVFSNYSLALKELTYEGVSFFEMLFNSVYWAGMHVVLNLAPMLVFSYVVARFDFPFKRTLLFINYVTMIVHVTGTLSADYVYFYDLGILNTRFMVLGALGSFGTTMFIVMSFFRSLSWGYAEAAEIDGANEFTILLKIYLPMMVPIIAALGLVRFIATWNDYYGPLLYMDSYPTLASGLYNYRIYSVERKGNYPIYFAGLIITLTPVIILYSCFSNTIMKNMGIGGLKG